MPDEGKSNIGECLKLKRIVLSNCSEKAVNDAVVDYCCKGSVNADSDGKGLVYADFSGSGSSLTDVCMESIAKHCYKTIRELNVSFCHKITDKGLGYLCEKATDQFAKVKVWGMAQLTDDFYDGHDRGDNFIIEGIWMSRAQHLPSSGAK